MFFLWLLRIVLLCTFVNKYLCQHLFPIVLGLYLWTELLARIIILCLIYWGITELFFYSSYIILHSHKQYLRVSVSTTLPILVIFHFFFFIMTILVVVKWYLMILIHFPNDINHLFMYLLASCVCLLEKYLFKPCAYF